jgi:hypothetical protein
LLLSFAYTNIPLSFASIPLLFLFVCLVDDILFLLRMSDRAERRAMLKEMFADMGDNEKLSFKACQLRILGCLEESKSIETLSLLSDNKKKNLLGLTKFSKELVEISIDVQTLVPASVFFAPGGESDNEKEKQMLPISDDLAESLDNYVN